MKTVPRPRLRDAPADPTALPLSTAQIEVWLAQQLAPRDTLFNVGGYLEISGAIDFEVFTKALRMALQEAGSPLSRFQETSAGVRQLPGDVRDVPILFFDLTGEADPHASALAWMDGDIATPFDLVEGPLCRFALLKLREDAVLCYSVFHHLVTDFFGARVLERRTANLYGAAMSGRAAPSETLTPWPEVLDDELAYRQSDRFQRDRAYWRERLANRPETATLSGRPPAWPQSTLRTQVRVQGSTMARLQELGDANGASLVAALFSAAALQLLRLTGERDLILGMPVNARTSASLRRSSGFLSNILPLRLTVDPAGTAAQLIQHCGMRIREAFRHCRYPSSALRSDLGVAPNESNIHGMTLNFLPEDAACDFSDQPAKLHAFLPQAGVQDLNITVHAHQDGFDATIQFDANAAHYGQAALDAHAHGFLTLLEGLLENPQSTLQQLPVMSDRERQRIRASPDGRALPPPPQRLPAQRQGPQTPTEARLAAVWCEVLRVPILDRSDDFFDLGGHSLLALQVVTRVREMFRTELPLKQLFDHPTLQSLAARIDEAIAGGASQAAAPVTPVEWTGPARLSYSQERMWLIQSLSPTNTAYNMGAALWLHGELDIAAAASSFDALIARHEILRTHVRLIDDRLCQIVEPARPGMLRCTDLRAHADAPAEALRRAQLDLRTPFDLGSGPVFRAQLLQTAERTFLLSLALHHIAGDQWSLGILGRELSALYNRRRAGDTAPLEPLPISYRDFAHWERSGGRETQIAEQLRFWRRELADLPIVDLPADRPRPRLWTMNGALHRREIPPHLFAAAARLARNSGSTLFMTFLAAYAALLQRITGQRDLPIGVPVANRALSAVEALVGVFVNTVIIRADVRGDPAFGELLARIRRTALDAFAKQDVSFDRLVQELAQRSDRSHAPLAQVLFNVTNAPMHGIQLDGMSWEPAALDRGGAQFELSFTVDTEITRTLTVEYNSDLFERGTIARLTDQYFALLESAARAPETRVSSLSILPTRQRAALQRWNDTSVALPAGTFCASFATQVARSPRRVAIAFDGSTLTYGELDARATALAGALRRAGVRRGERVAVCVRRSPELLVSLLAVQKSGGAYVPLDPDFPPARLEYMLEDSGTQALLTSGPLPGVTLPQGVQVIDVTTPLPAPVQGFTDDMDAPLPEDPVYVIYTSGSTGRPKGVTVTHGALANCLQSMSATPGLSESDVLAAVTTVSFDIAALELYLPLRAGARIELVAREVASDGTALAHLLESAGVTVMQATPATWRLLIDAGWRGSARLKALCGGEALSRNLADQILDRAAELWNLYGPTETTIWSSVERVERGSQAISIGRPITNTRIHVLDDSGAVVPIGVVGEICIAGAGVALGYHGLPALTTERFIADSHSGVPGSRLYKTGDLGRWGADGKLYHVGRSDHQIKLRGFRIELEEIEQALTSYPAIKQAVVVVREAAPEDSRLVAYVVLDEREEATVSEIRSHLRGLLPQYMMPSVVMPLITLPLSPSGKLDRAALPDPFAGRDRDAGASEAPPGELERQLAEIWMSVLKLAHVGRSDNFFELGGYSLLALRVAQQILSRTGRRLDPRALFFHDLREVAEMLEREPVRGDVL